MRIKGGGGGRGRVAIEVGGCGEPQTCRFPMGERKKMARRDSDKCSGAVGHITLGDRLFGCFLGSERGGCLPQIRRRVVATLHGQWKITRLCLFDFSLDYWVLEKVMFLLLSLISIQIPFENILEVFLSNKYLLKILENLDNIFIIVILKNYL